MSGSEKPFVPLHSLNQEDLDLLALLLEGLSSESKPRSRRWLVDFLAGPSPSETSARLFAEDPTRVTGMARAIIQMTLRFNYSRGRRIFQRKIPQLLSAATDAGLVVTTRQFLKKFYTITPRARDWLEHDYSQQRTGIDMSDKQAWYDAQKLCQTLAREGSALTRQELIDKAFPLQEVPPDASPRLRAILDSYVKSIPKAFERALETATSLEWIVEVEDKWHLTPEGKEEGCQQS